MEEGATTLVLVVNLWRVNKSGVMKRSTVRIKVINSK
jgi:hypothetical protein